jgi:carbamoyl-phosphate synthase large subunit
MNRRKITVAVTGLNNTDNPGPGVPVIRGLRESKEFDVRIIGLAYENLEPGIYLHDIVDKTYMLPYPSSGLEPLMERLEYIQKVENIEVLIPNFDAELMSMIKAVSRLKQMGIRTFLPTVAQFDERQKSNLPKYGKSYDVKVPRSEAVNSYNEILNLKEKYEYPLLVKGQFYEAYVANSPEQAGMYFHKLSAKWGLPIIIQEFIRGTEVNVIALGDGKGNTISAVPMRKQYITDKGKAWGGITLDDQKMLDLTAHLVKETKWRGAMELELIKSAKGEYYIIEINPRIPAWVYLAVGAGQNIPEALVKLALGMEVKPYTEYAIGKMFIRYSWDHICDIKEFEKLSVNGEL